MSDHGFNPFPNLFLNNWDEHLEEEMFKLEPAASVQQEKEMEITTTALALNTTLTTEEAVSV